MHDADLGAIFRETLLSFLTRFQQPAIEVLRGNDVTIQGRADSAVYYFPIATMPEGAQRRKYADRDVENRLDLMEKQRTVTTLQIQVVHTERRTGPTAMDICKSVRQVVQSLPFITALAHSKISVRRPSEIRPPYVVSDSNRYEMVPSFDLPLVHSDEITIEIPAIADVRHGIYPI